MKTVPTFTAKIAVGLRHHKTGKIISFDTAEKIIERFVARVPRCVSVTRTDFIYTGGREPGLLIELINYPRFPSTAKEIRSVALNLARDLKKGLRQRAVSVIMTDKTIMLGHN